MKPFAITGMLIMAMYFTAYAEYIDHRLYRYESNMARYKEGETFVIVKNDSGQMTNQLLGIQEKSTLSKTPLKPRKITIYFAINSAQISPSEQEKLNRFITNNPKAVFRATGYTCPLGTPEINQRVAAARVEAVDRIFKSRNLQLDRKEVKSNCCYVALDKEHYWKNRRVEVEYE